MDREAWRAAIRGVAKGRTRLSDWTEQLKTELSYDSAVKILAIYLKKTKNTNSKRYMLPPVHCSISYNSQDGKAASVSISAWMDKDVLHIHTKEYYLAIY